MAVFQLMKQGEKGSRNQALIEGRYAEAGYWDDRSRAEAALVEEVAFRGYFQSKMIALLGDDTPLHIALGIGATTIAFGAMHTPSAIVAGRSLGGVFSAALAPTLTVVLFGVFYELTHNVYFVALLHGFGNTWPIVVEWTNWSGNALIAFWVGTTCIYLGVTLAYRYWMNDYDSRMTIKRNGTSSPIQGE